MYNLHGKQRIQNINHDFIFRRFVVSRKKEEIILAIKSMENSAIVVHYTTTRIGELINVSLKMSTNIE